MYTHPLRASYSEISELFGENADRAKRIIDQRKKDIADGLYSDDYQYCKDRLHEELSSWTYMEVSENILKSKLFSFIEDELLNMTEGEIRIISYWTRIEYFVNKEIKREKDDKERGDIKLANATIKKLKNQYQKIADIWNKIYEDDVITPEELRTLSDTVKRYRIYSKDFEDFLDFCYCNVIPKGRVDKEDIIKLYEYMVQILDTFKNRINTKIEQENQALKQ